VAARAQILSRSSFAPDTQARAIEMTAGPECSTRENLRNVTCHDAAFTPPPRACSIGSRHEPQRQARRLREMVDP